MPTSIIHLIGQSADYMSPIHAPTFSLIQNKKSVIKIIWLVIHR
jgi:hypothetical protein